MTASRLLRCSSGVVVAVLALAASGCGWNHYNQTQIDVRFSGDTLLVLASIPRALPDGKPCGELRDALIEDVAKTAGAYSYIPNVATGYVSAPGEPTVTSQADLLMVEGPPELASILRRKLHEDFKQERPWVTALPTQAVALVPLPAPEAPAALPEGSP